MDAYTSNYLIHSSSETFKKFYCLNLTKQQEREYKSQQKNHIPFDVSKITESDRGSLAMSNFEHTKLTQPQFKQLALLLTQFKQCYSTSKFDVGKIKVELNLPLKSTAVFKKQSNRHPSSNTRKSTTLTRYFNTFRYKSTCKHRFTHYGKHFD